MIEHLKQQFIEPSDEFTPIPFWFWNDELSKQEIVRQIHDFHAKEVAGFVIHPRMGLPHTQPYLSAVFMELVEAAVKEAAGLGMSVILYDEGMYPSGAANGLVVKQNPEYASRGLRLDEHKCPEAGEMLQIEMALSPGESVVSVQAVCKNSHGEIILAESMILDASGGKVHFTPPLQGEWFVLAFIDTYSNGHIRGIHFGQDDGDDDSPRSADLLNPEATRAFLSLTHEKYYDKLKAYFGSTIIAMFTDEPDMLGRGHTQGLKPWTKGFLKEAISGGIVETDLPLLWFNDAGQETQRVRHSFNGTVQNRLSKVYYKQLYDWCTKHDIALTGHPAASDDIGLLTHFHIPGQDVVWRYIAPEAGKSLSGSHSTLGKCSSDAARHRGRRRNLNECFGVCGKESGWALSADEMKWYLDWLFIRGVNLISPHAFYYSIRDDRRNERPPDVGPNNIWWNDYRHFARYIKRMSWLMTDSYNVTEVAVICQAAHLPWRSVKPLYEQQIEFNYLEEDLLHSSCELIEGSLHIAKQRYRVVVIEDGELLKLETWQLLRQFVNQGGIVLELDEGMDAKIDMVRSTKAAISRTAAKNIGQRRVPSVDDLPQALKHCIRQDARLAPSVSSLRISHVKKEQLDIYAVVNEGEEAYEGTIQTRVIGKVEIWHPWTGTTEEASAINTEAGMEINLRIQRRECLMIIISPQQKADKEAKHGCVLVETIDLSNGWLLEDRTSTIVVEQLSSWTERKGMEYFSGTITYKKSFQLNELELYSQIQLDLGDVHELAHVWLNGEDLGVQMWKPYVFSVQDLLRPGENQLRIAVTNSLANRYDRVSLVSGLIGPVRLLCYETGPL